MTQVVPDLELYICRLVLFDLSSTFIIQSRLGRRIFGWVGTLMSEIYLLISEDLSATDHNEERR